MSIRRGSQWGLPGELPEGAPVVSSDRELRSLVEDVRRRGGELPVVGLTGGDLWRTLGAPGGGPSGRRGATRVAVDLGSVLLDGRIHWFVSHLVARATWLWGRCWVVANAAHRGSWNLAPRAHPGDGLLDVLDADLPPGQRLAAVRRLHAGDHVPHPSISYRRVAAAHASFTRPVGVVLDGERTGRAREVSVRIEPAALEVVV